MVDPLVLSHRELRAALHLAERELRRRSAYPPRQRLLELVKRALDDAKLAALVCGAEKNSPPEEARDATTCYSSKPRTAWGEVLMPDEHPFSGLAACAPPLEERTLAVGEGRHFLP